VHICITGSGGASAPASSQAAPAKQASTGINESQPATTLQIRLADGSKLTGRFNLTQTVQVMLENTCRIHLNGCTKVCHGCFCIADIAETALHSPLVAHVAFSMHNRPHTQPEQYVYLVYRFIDASSSQGGSYKLTTSYPRKELTDLSQTLQAADVADTVLTVSKA